MRTRIGNLRSAREKIQRLIATMLIDTNALIMAAIKEGGISLVTKDLARMLWQFFVLLAHPQWRGSS